VRYWSFRYVMTIRCINISFEYENRNHHTIFSIILTIYSRYHDKFLANILEKSISQKIIWSCTTTPLIWKEMKSRSDYSDEILDDTSIISSSICNNDVLPNLRRIDIKIVNWISINYSYKKINLSYKIFPCEID